MTVCQIIITARTTYTLCPDYTPGPSYRVDCGRPTCRRSATHPVGCVNGLRADCAACGQLPCAAHHNCSNRLEQVTRPGRRVAGFCNDACRYRYVHSTNPIPLEMSQKTLQIIGRVDLEWTPNYSIPFNLFNFLHFSIFRGFGTFLCCKTREYDQILRVYRFLDN